MGKVKGHSVAVVGPRAARRSVPRSVPHGAHEAKAGAGAALNLGDHARAYAAVELRSLARWARKQASQYNLVRTELAGRGSGRTGVYAQRGLGILDVAEEIDRRASRLERKAKSALDEADAGHYCTAPHPEDGPICTGPPGHKGLHRAGFVGPTWRAARAKVAPVVHYRCGAVARCGMWLRPKIEAKRDWSRVTCARCLRAREGAK